MKTPTMLDQLVAHPIVKKILEVLPKTAELFIVGGAVRDALLERPVTDLDFVVRHIPLAELQKLLSTLGEVDEKGMKWGVLTVALDGESIDVALPRNEQGSAEGEYHETTATPDPKLPIESDLKRRDFTINSMAVNTRTGKLVDPFHGKVDTLQKMLRTVGNPETRFAEDHSRILRCLRLATQLGFAIEPITWEGLHTVVLKAGQLHVPKRIWEQEFAKAQVDLPTFHELLKKAGIEKSHV
jgi:tRNA nucleotidyltransferase (CCA-adding enzyme)